MSYIAGHEHYPEHNNWKRGFVESAVSSYSATDGFCGDGRVAVQATTEKM